MIPDDRGEVIREILEEEKIRSGAVGSVIDLLATNRGAAPVVDSPAREAAATPAEAESIRRPTDATPLR